MLKLLESEVGWERGTGEKEVVGFDRCEELGGEGLDLLAGDVLEVVHSEETLFDLPPPILLTLVPFLYTTLSLKDKPQPVSDHPTKTTVLLVKHFLSGQLGEQVSQ